MKKILAAVVTIAACAALCAAVWPRSDEVGVIAPVNTKTIITEKEKTVPPQTSEPEAPTPEPSAPPSETTQEPVSDPPIIYRDDTYSEEPLNDASSVVWIDGRAYMDVPGFGLVECGGPSRIILVPGMVENGNKVGSMGGDEAPPDYKPQTTPPSDPSAGE